VLAVDIHPDERRPNGGCYDTKENDVGDDGPKL
jgi:hypothetical protein